MNNLPGQPIDNSIGSGLEPQRAFHDLREFKFPTPPQTPRTPRAYKSPEVVDVGCFCGFRSVKKTAKTHGR